MKAFDDWIMKKNPKFSIPLLIGIIVFTFVGIPVIVMEALK